MHLPSNLAQNHGEWLQLVLAFLEENRSAEDSELPWEDIFRIYNSCQKGNEGDFADDEQS